MASYYKHKPMAMAMASSNLKRYMNSKGGKEFMERAPSTADIMKSMEEEKERKAQKKDRSKGDAPTPESGKESYKKQDPSKNDNNRQAGDT